MRRQAFALLSAITACLVGATIGASVFAAARGEGSGWPVFLGGIAVVAAFTTLMCAYDWDKS